MFCSAEYTGLDLGGAGCQPERRAELRLRVRPQARSRRPLCGRDSTLPACQEWGCRLSRPGDRAKHTATLEKHWGQRAAPGLFLGKMFAETS